MISKALLTDLYQLTMMQGLFKKNMHRTPCVFDRFYRKNPFDGAYTVVAGLEHVIDYLEHLAFNEDDIAYLRSTGIFEEDFLEYLKDFRFTGSVVAAPEGTVVFPGEVLLRVKAPKDEAMLIETPLSMYLNHESLIATKARRIRSVAGHDSLAEFGMRRAQGTNAAVYGARATIIGGFNGTSNVYSAAQYGIKPVGTMAHSWIMSFSDELTAFRAYAEQYENMLVLLVDTYDTLRKGVPAAIQVFKEVRERRGGTMPKGYGVRLDSGDLSYLSQEVRKMMDDAGFNDAIIFASNDLDEYTIADLKHQGCAISSWGVGTKLITADGTPALGGVYKLAGQWADDGTFTPTIKFSDNIEKLTNPGFKKVLRLINRRNHKLIGDLICLDDETVDTTKPYDFVNPQYPWKCTHLEADSFDVVPLLQPIFEDGKLVYNKPSLNEIVDYAEDQMRLLWPEYFRLQRPPVVKVNISKALFELKSSLLLKKVGDSQQGKKRLTEVLYE
ncbi:MAG: nicotinate phosphoribosyltransferase [Veillonella sp.]|nr:nicotinate phosphoribosyltransferase [Veillonella sp.]